MKNLSEKALLVNLTITMWSATKIDKKVTREVEENHNAKDAGRFNKILIAKKDIAKVNSIATRARDIHKEYTLPWNDNGERLLPATNYFEYISKQREIKQKFDEAVEAFINNYPDLKEDARRRLNGMFNEKDYPIVPKLRRKFSMESSFMPIAKLDDFRITVDEDESDEITFDQEEVEKLREEIEQDVYKRINATTQDLWIRIKEVVAHMYEKLVDKDAIFRDSLVTNIRDLIDLLPRLNFTNDPDISIAIGEMKKLDVSPEYLRTSIGKRTETATNAKELLNKINDFIGDIFQDEDSGLLAA